MKVVSTFELKLADFYKQGFSDYCLQLSYLHKVSADMSSGLHMFVELGKTTRNFEQRPLLNPRGSPVLILLAITGYHC